MLYENENDIAIFTTTKIYGVFHFYKTIFLQKHMKNSHVLQLLEHMDAGPYAFVILEFVILDFYPERDTVAVAGVVVAGRYFPFLK